MTRARVIVIGGGLAGVAAAFGCRDAGFDVTVLESRARLGGAACSFRRGQLTVDTGQHVFLRCYKEYRALLRRCGVADGVSIQPRLRIPIVRPGGESWVLRRSALPAPAHLAPALIGYHALSMRQCLEAARVAMALRRLDPDDRDLDQIAFGDWLDQQGASARTIEALWGLLTEAALNIGPRRASLALAARVFQTGMLSTTDGGDIGLPLRPLGELHDSGARRALTAAGVAVHPRTKARRVLRTESGLRVVLGDDTTMKADAVVVAVTHPAAAKLLEELSIPETRDWFRLSASPIVNVHVRYDRQVTDKTIAAALDSPVQWVFDRTRIAGQIGGQYLAVSLSAADTYVDARTSAVREIFLPALEKLFPAARDASVLDFFVTREREATFLQAPGTGQIRPGPRTRIPGLVLAGAWTATGWPDTLEGAVRSGNQAAEQVAAQQQQTSFRGTEVTA